MNNAELDSILKKAKMPEITDESLAFSPRRIVARLREDPPPARATATSHPWRARAFGLAICAGIALSLGYAGWRMKTTPPTDPLTSAKLIRETLAMFPNRVRTIMQDEHGLRLILSDRDDVPSSPPLYIHICDGKTCSSYVTFSGQEIQADGQTVMVLADAQGGIILTGQQFVWSSTGRTEATRQLKIEAENLGTSAL